MGSFASNFLTIVILAVVTFVVLDVNQSTVFEKSTTAKYLNKIGATPYVSKSIVTIRQSKFYRQYVLPYWNSLVRFLRPYVNSYQATVVKYSNQAATWIQKHSVRLVDYVDGTVLPVAKEHSARYWILLQNYFNRIYAVVSEQTLLVSHWLSKNVFAKLPQEEIQKAFVNFVVSTQKAAIDSFQWASGQIQKLIV